MTATLITKLPLSLNFLLQCGRVHICLLKKFMWDAQGMHTFNIKKIILTFLLKCVSN
jgi:hypothetical protein